MTLHIGASSSFCALCSNYYQDGINFRELLLVRSSLNQQSDSKGVVTFPVLGLQWGLEALCSQCPVMMRFVFIEVRSASAKPLAWPLAGLELTEGLGGLNPPSSGLDLSITNVSTPPDLFVFLMYFVHEFGSTPLALW